MAILKDSKPYFYVVVVAQNDESFQGCVRHLSDLGFSNDKVIWCNPATESRLDIIQNYKNTWLCFLDHDCRLNQNTIDTLNNLIEEAASDVKAVYAGQYTNSLKSGYLQKAHNFIANGWMAHSFDQPRHVRFFLGGAFLIRSEGDFSEYAFENFWGAEDKYLAYVLQEKGFSVLKSEGFLVEHNTSSKFIHFVRRAYLHGLNEKKNKFHRKEKISYWFWLRRFDSSNLYLLPPVVFHFCIQKAARLMRKVLR